METPEAGRGSSAPVLIVGAGPRLGAAIARAVAGDSRPVGLIGRSAERAAELAQSLRAEGLDAHGDGADVADPTALTAAIERLADRVGPFGVAVHNVSVWREAGAGSLTAADLLADVAAGTASFVTLTNAVMPAMTAMGGGTVIATGSGAADHPTPGAPSLAVQKAGLRMLALAFAAELAPSGVHVATVTISEGLDSPGFAVADIAGVYRELVVETSGPRTGWRTEVRFAGG